MDNKDNSVIITPAHVFDFDLITKIIPSVRVGERVMRLDTIEHVEYEEEIDDSPENDDAIDKIQVLVIYHTGGGNYQFSPDEAVELEAAIHATIKRSEDAQAKAKAEQQEMMTQAAQEAYRRELQQVQVPNIKTGFRPGSFKR